MRIAALPSIASAALACIFFAGPNQTLAAERTSTSPKLALNFTELPPSIKRLRFAFACDDGLEIEARWIAQDVGDAAPPDYVIGSYKLITRGPLNLISLSRPEAGWPLGLYWLELIHQNKPIHVERYVIDHPQE